jgi:hypothetical protein
MHAQHLRAHPHAQFRVQVGQRLVHQEDRRLAHDRPPHRDPLPLAAAQLRWLAAEQVSQAQRRRRGTDAPVPVRLRHLLVGEREPDVLGHGQMRVERVVLEDHRDVTLPRRDIVDHPVTEPRRGPCRGAAGIVPRQPMGQALG